MAAVQPLNVYDQQPYDQESLSGSDSGDEGSKGNGLTSCATFCCCICCFWVFGMVGNIIGAVASIGYTACPTAVPILAPNTTLPTIPPRSMLVRDYYQGSSGSSSGMGRGITGSLWTETDVFDPLGSNATRVGYWRDTRTWYGRGQWAYVLNGAKEPSAVAWQPWFAWMRTYEVKWCFPVKQYTASQAQLWFWSWGSSMQKWSIAQNGVMVATADAQKAWNQPFLLGQAAPNGWHTTVTSATLPGTIVGTSNQIIDGYFPTKETWQVDVNRTDLLDPFIVSFMAAETFHESDGNNNDGRRRRR
jgi:hypothetical protein